MTPLRDRVRNAFARTLARPFAQRAWSYLYHMSLRGMNVGEGGDPRTSGEVHAIDHARRAAIRAGVASPVVVDCGANHGVWSQLAAARWPEAQVVALEPAPDVFEALRANVASLPGVRPVNVGLGEVSETVRMYRPVDSDGDVTGVTSIYQGIWEEDVSVIPLVQEIQLLSLRDFMEREALDHVDLLKLDVEGNEFPILRGAREAIEDGLVGHVQFEFGLANVRQGAIVRDFWNLLAPTHEMYRVLPTGLWRIPEWSNTLEVPVCTNFLAIPRGERAPRAARHATPARAPAAAPAAADRAAAATAAEAPAAKPR